MESRARVNYGSRIAVFFAIVICINSHTRANSHYTAMDVKDEPEASPDPPGAVPWTVRDAPRMPGPLVTLHDLGLAAGMSAQALEQRTATAGSAGQPAEGGLGSPAPQPGLGVEGPPPTGQASVVKMSTGSAGSPAVTAGGIASGVQHSGQEGDGEQGSGSGGRQMQPAAAGSAKPVVRSREQFMRVSLLRQTTCCS